MFKERLSTIASRLDGLILATLLASDGMPVESYAADEQPESLDPDVLAVELLTQLRALSENHGEMGLGEVSEFSVCTSSYAVMLGRLAPGYYLMLVLAGSPGLGRARFELRRAPLAFEEDLS